MGNILNVLMASLSIAAADIQTTVNSWKGSVKENEHGQWATLKNGIAMLVKDNKTQDRCASLRIIVEDFSAINETDEKQHAKQNTALTICIASDEKLVGERASCKVISCDLAFKDPKESEWEQIAHAFKQKIHELKVKNLTPQGVVLVGNFSERDALCWFDRFFEEEKFLTRLEENIAANANSVPVLVEISYSYSQKNAQDPDFQYAWMQNLLHSLFMKRLEANSEAARISLKMKPSSALFPFQKCTFYTVTDEEGFLNDLNVLIYELDKVKEKGFSREEFIACKEEWQGKLFRLASSLSYFDNSVLADYYAYQLLNQDDYASFSSLLQTSWDILDGIGYEEFSNHLSSFLTENNRHIHILSLPNNQNVETLFDQNQTLHFPSRDIKSDLDAHLYLTERGIPIRLTSAYIRPEEKSKNPFVFEQAVAQQTYEWNPPANENSLSQLPITEDEKGIIDYIITTMAEKNVIKLALMRKTMEKKGDKIHHVHPFRFLEHVFSNPKLKSCMHKIRKSGFKWDGFIDGFSKKMKEEAQKNNLLPYVSALARALNVNPDQIANFIYKKDYEGLVKFFMLS